MFKKAEIVVPPTRYEAAVSFAEERIVAPAKEMTTAAWDSVPEEIKSIVASKAGMVALAVMLLALVIAAAFRPRSSAVEKKVSCAHHVLIFVPRCDPLAKLHEILCSPRRRHWTTVRRPP